MWFNQILGPQWLTSTFPGGCIWLYIYFKNMMHACWWCLKGHIYLYEMPSVKLFSDLLNISWNPRSYWNALLLLYVNDHYIQG